MSIALPSFLFEKNNQLLILGSFAFSMLVIFPCCVYKWFSSDRRERDPDTGVLVENLNIYLNDASKMKEAQVIPMIASSFEFQPGAKLNSQQEASELNILLSQIPKHIQNTCKKHIFSKNIVLIHAHIMNLQMLNKDLSDAFKMIRSQVPKILEFYADKTFEFVVLYHMNQLKLQIPINNAYLFLEFCKKFLNRIHTDDWFEIFTEKLDEGTIEKLRNKNVALKQFANQQNREKLFKKFTIEARDTEIINDYFESLPKFEISEVSAYVKGCDNVEVGDLATLKVKITLTNHESQLVATNIARTTFKYPNQKDTINKLPKLYMVVSDKFGKILMYNKIPMSSFLKNKEPDSTEELKDGKIELEESKIFKSKTIFQSDGNRKVVVKIVNDSYLFIDSNMQKDFTIKVDPKSVDKDEAKDNKSDDQESVDDGN